MVSTEFVQDAAATLHECEATGGDQGEELDFESALSGGSPEALATLLASDPVGSFMLCRPLQRAGFYCQVPGALEALSVELEEEERGGAPHSGSALRVDVWTNFTHSNGPQCRTTPT